MVSVTKRAADDMEKGSLSTIILMISRLLQFNFKQVIVKDLFN